MGGTQLVSLPALVCPGAETGASRPRERLPMEGLTWWGRVPRARPALGQSWEQCLTSASRLSSGPVWRELRARVRLQKRGPVPGRQRQLRLRPGLDGAAL